MGYPMSIRLVCVAALATCAVTLADAEPAAAQQAVTPGATSDPQAPAAESAAPEASQPEAPAEGVARPDQNFDPYGGEPPPKPRVHRRPQHLSPEQVIENRVHVLTKALDLSGPQQTKLRQILQAQRQQIQKVWAANPRPAADRVGPTTAILERTRDQIRAMLTESQKKKYQAAVPREQLGPAYADPDHWMQLTRQGQQSSAQKPTTTDGH